jgi:hypothetical protein
MGWHHRYKYPGIGNAYMQKNPVRFVVTLRFCRSRWKGCAFTNPAGALFADGCGVRYRLAGKSKWKSQVNYFVPKTRGTQNDSRKECAR